MLIHFFSAPNGRPKEKCPTIKRTIVVKINRIQISKHCNCPNAVRNTTTFIKFTPISNTYGAAVVIVLFCSPTNSHQSQTLAVVADCCAGF